MDPAPVKAAVSCRLPASLPPDRQRIFALTMKEVPGPYGAVRQETAYVITRDGFTLLEMGITRQEALPLRSVAVGRKSLPGRPSTAHGFRAMALTMAVERLGVDKAIVDAQLAHAVGGPLGRAYDRTQFHEQRRELTKQWADYLDRLRDGAKVVPLPVRAA